MANKKKKRFQFQLGWPGMIFSIGLLICLFLWMFVLGFYFGQRVVGERVKKLSSPISEKALTSEGKEPPPPVFEEVTPPPLAEEKLASARGEKPLSEAKKGKTAPPSPKPVLPPREEKTAAQREEKATPRPIKSQEKFKKTTKAKSPQKFYAVQVASLRSASEAQKYVNYLRDKGYEAFFRQVTLPQKGTWYRVYVGRFKSISEARAFGEKLKKKEKLKAFYIQKLES